MQSGDLRAGLDAQLGVQVREGLVHEEHGRLADDCPPERDALALAAGELLGFAREKSSEIEDPGCLLDALLDICLGDLSELEPEGQVVANGHVRVERVALEDHGNVTVLGRHVVHDAIPDPQRSVRNLLEPRDHPEARRLAAA